MDEFGRRGDFEELAFERIRLASGDSRRAPVPALANVAAPLACIEHARIDPPVYDLLRRQSLENALRRRRDLDAGEDLPFHQVSDGTCAARRRTGHFASRLRFN